MHTPDAAAPVISVLMGVYYRKTDTALLERSVRSILKQTFGDFEFLICDDGSTAEAASLLEDLAAEDSRIRLVRVGTLFNLPQKLNACLASARGKFLARMDDDDYSHPERFEKQVAYLKTHPEVSFVGCNVNLVQDGREIAQKSFPANPSVQDFYMTQPYIHPTLLFRKEVINIVGGYSEDKYCDHCEDYDLLLRLYAKGFRGVNLQQVLFDYTAPNVKGNRTMRHRRNECITRYRRFQELGVLPQAFPYVIKPIVVGMIPAQILRRWKESAYEVQQ